MVVCTLYPTCTHRNTGPRAHGYREPVDVAPVDQDRGAPLPATVLRRYFAGAQPRGRTPDAVTDALREAILDGSLQPSTWLREDELASAFQVSRTPVREALRRLADEGLAVKTAHHGTVVAPLSLEDVLALYVVRVDLEGLAARLAASRRPADLVPRLERVHDSMRACADRGDVAQMARENLHFHRLLREAAGNPYLERFLTQVEHAVRRVPSTFTIAGRVDQVLAEHEAVLDAVRRGDGEAAEVAAKEHMRQAREVRLRSVIRS
jgi:DNA-binding GntR family transcriptional regulator